MMPIESSLPPTDLTPLSLTGDPAGGPTSDPASYPTSDSASNPDFDYETELPRSQRIDLAYKVWKDAAGALSKTTAAADYGIPKSTLIGRINGATSSVIARQRKQRLSPEEESVLVKWITRLQVWGWPARVEQARFMAEDLLRAKGDSKPLGINWTQKFLKRHKQLKTKYIPPLDKERALAQDPYILSDWFQLYQRIKAEFNVQDSDIYNMDEKGFLQGVIAKLKVMLSKYETNQHMTHCGNREWTTLIETISLTGRSLRPWIIFKAQLQQKAWVDAYPEGHFTCSENGWTNNEIGLCYFQTCFDPETTLGQKGEWRILILDGHASHISTRTIEYCITKKIILLCLPAHTTHLLQPLDVGVFAPLSTAYKKHVYRITRLGAGYAIDKVDFLEILRLARQDTVNSTNILKAWQACGLSPYNPQLILQKFPLPAEKASQAEHYQVTIRPTTPPEAVVKCDGPNGTREAIMTPGNTLQVQRLLEKALHGQDAQKIVQKVCKSAIVAMAECTIQERTNADLLAHAQRKEGKKRRRKGNIGLAQVMNQEVLDERQETDDWDTEWGRLGRIYLNIFGRQQKKKPKANTSGRRTSATPARRTPAKRAPKQLLVTLRVRIGLGMRKQLEQEQAEDLHGQQQQQQQQNKAEDLHGQQQQQQQNQAEDLHGQQQQQQQNQAEDLHGQQQQAKGPNGQELRRGERTRHPRLLD